MSSGHSIRPAHEYDVDRIVSWALEYLRATSSKDVPAADIAMFARNAIFNPNAAVLIADGGVIFGEVSLSMELTQVAVIRALYAVQRGLSVDLLAAFCRWAKGQGAKKIVTGALDMRQARWFRKQGFSEGGVRMVSS